jgi:hypothetical protein
VCFFVTRGRPLPRIFSSIGGPVVVVWRQLAPLVGVGVMNQAAVSRINGNRAPRYLWHRHETGQRFMLLRTNHGRRRGRVGSIVVGSSTEPASRPLTTRMRAVMVPSKIVLLWRFMILPVFPNSYFDMVSDALATLAGDAFAAVSSTTTVIFMPAWPSPQ